MRYKNVYWSIEELRRSQDGFASDILAIGDSWFWYPMPGGSLINFIGDLVAPQGHNILVAGHNGAEVYDYVQGKHRRQVKEMLRLYGGSASAVLVSGGGNDFAGVNDLLPLLKPDCSGFHKAADCFKGGDGEGTLGFLMEKMYEHYALLVTRIFAAAPPTAAVLVHDYDYAVPDGRGVGGGRAWLKPAFDSALVPAALQADCVKRLIDRCHGVLQRIAAGAGGRVVLIDSRGTLSHADWANELHPRPAGFRKIARTHWRPALARLGLA
jgi:hypothetical protein